MKALRLLIPLSILLLAFTLFAEALPTELVSIQVQTSNLMQLSFQNDQWTVNNGSIEMPLLQVNEDGQPTHAVLLGVPTEEVEWRIILAESTPVELTHSLPETELVILNSDMHLRDQPVVQLTFNPIQPDANGARVYTKIVVELTWDKTKLELKPNHPAYEQLLAETLFNYETLERPLPETAHTPQLQRYRAMSPTLRIIISETGLYQLPFADLLTAGFSTDDPTNLRLTNRGKSIATLVSDDALLFFGEAYEDLYTTENVYWLTVGAGIEMGTVNESHPTASVAAHFSNTVHLEENTLYWNTMPSGEGEDHWFWGERISPNASGLESARTFTATLPTVSSTPTVTLRVQLKGYTTLDHKTRISLNEHLVDEQIWSGQTVYTHTIPVTGSLLAAGQNVITVEAADTGAVVDQLYVNWIEIDYASSYTAIDDTIFFAPPAAGTFAFTVTGFTTDTLYLFDITNPHQPMQISHTVRNGSLHFQQTVTDGIRFFATAIKSVPQTALDSVSHWKDEGNSADWLIITHSDFITPAHRLADHRTAQGLQTAVVNIQDVYDEFGDGFFNPNAIRDFLAYTYDNWQSPAPTYVVLLGDGSQDYKDQLGSGERNFIPPKLIHTQYPNGSRNYYYLIPSDHWFVTFTGNDIFADMFIGRLSADTLSQASAIVDNIIAYEMRPAPEHQRALFVADDVDQNFEANSEQLIDRFPNFFDIDRIYARTYTTPYMTRDITQTLLSGTTIVNYAGHGTYFRWGSYRSDGKTQRIFTADQADVLKDTELNPFVTVANCLNGYFSIPTNIMTPPYESALAESLQRQANGGAVAVWADAGLGYNSEQRILLNAFYDSVFENSLGVAADFAKTQLYLSSSYWEQNVRTMTLFGDPATKLQTNEALPTALMLTNITIQTNHLRLILTTLALISLGCGVIYRLLTRT